MSESDVAVSSVTDEPIDAFEQKLEPRPMHIDEVCEMVETTDIEEILLKKVDMCPPDTEIWSGGESYRLYLYSSSLCVAYDSKIYSFRNNRQSRWTLDAIITDPETVSDFRPWINGEPIPFQSPLWVPASELRRWLEQNGEL